MQKLRNLKRYYFFYPIFFILGGVLITTVSCNKSHGDHETTYFGGKIKNPKEAYVYFLKDDKVLDSAKINKQNRFSFHLDSIREGLYSFKHGPEFQYLYLQPQDSLLIYLNTWDFDESLIFSGKNAAKNNFLVEVFNLQEKTEKKFRSYYSLDESDFNNKITEELQPFIDKYEHLKEQEDYDETDFFKKLAKVVIYYPFYSKKEYYPLKHKDSHNRPDYPKVNNDFYTYRNDITLNDESLMSLRSYTYYIEAFLYNAAYQKVINNPEKNNFSLNFMQAVNENIKNKKLKDRYLVSGFWGSFKENLTDEEQKDIQNYFFKNCHTKIYIAEAKKAIQQFNQLRKGDSLPHLLIYNTEGQEVDMHKIVKDKKAVIYFWPENKGRKEVLLSNLKKYRREFPDVLFIGIERGDNNNAWKKFIRSNRLKKNSQFKIDQNCKMYPLFEGDMERTLILNEQGIVQNPYLFFNDKYNLEKNLHLLKKQ